MKLKVCSQKKTSDVVVHGPLIFQSVRVCEKGLPED